jgi:hypothetical protein
MHKLASMHWSHSLLSLLPVSFPSPTPCLWMVTHIWGFNTSLSKMSHILWHFGRLSQLDINNNLHQVGWCVCVIIISPDTLIYVLRYFTRVKQTKISLLADVYFLTCDFVWWLCSTATVQIWLCLGELHHRTTFGKKIRISWVCQYIIRVLKAILWSESDPNP